MDKKTFIRKIIDSKISLDVLMEFERILDDNHFYAFDNWINGEVVGGPIIGKYHVNILLRYDEKPDFDALKRLDIFDIKYKVKKVGEVYYDSNEIVHNNVNPVTGSSVNNQLRNLEDKKVENYFWLVEFIVPKRLFEKNYNL